MELQTSVPPMNSQLISFRIDWFDITGAHGILKSLLKHRSLKTSCYYLAINIIGYSDHDAHTDFFE